MYVSALKSMRLLLGRAEPNTRNISASPSSGVTSVGPCGGGGASYVDLEGSKLEGQKVEVEAGIWRSLMLV